MSYDYEAPKPWWKKAAEFDNPRELSEYMYGRQGGANGLGALGGFALGAVAGHFISKGFTDALDSYEHHVDYGSHYETSHTPARGGELQALDRGLEWAEKVVMSSALPLVMMTNPDSKISIDAYIDELLDEGRPSWLVRSSSLTSQVSKIDRELLEAGFIPEEAYRRLPELKFLFSSISKAAEEAVRREEKLGRPAARSTAVFKKISESLPKLGAEFRSHEPLENFQRHFMKPFEFKAAEDLFLVVDVTVGDIPFEVMNNVLIFYSALKPDLLAPGRNVIEIVGDYFSVTIGLVGEKNAFVLEPPVSQIFKDHDVAIFAEAIEGYVYPNLPKT